MNYYQLDFIFAIQISSGQSEEQETIVSVTPVTATSGDTIEESNIPSIRIVSTDEQQRGQTEATESSTTPSEGLIKSRKKANYREKFNKKNIYLLEKT